MPPLKSLFLDFWVNIPLHNRRSTIAPIERSGQNYDANLGQADELNYSIFYYTAARFGILSFGLNYYLYPNSNYKKATNSEVFFSYALPYPILEDIRFNIYSQLSIGENPYDYANLLYDYSTDISSNAEFFLELKFGYINSKRKRGWNDYVLSLGFIVRGIYYFCSLLIQTEPLFFHGRRELCKPCDWTSYSTDRGTNNKSSLPVL